MRETEMLPRVRPEGGFARPGAGSGNNHLTRLSASQRKQIPSLPVAEEKKFFMQSDRRCAGQQKLSQSQHVREHFARDDGDAEHAHRYFPGCLAAP